MTHFYDVNLILHFLELFEYLDEFHFRLLKISVSEIGEAT